jgi:DNA segregation ATPase FtsK/SpoIIIE, S-DNA-T family
MTANQSPYADSIDGEVVEESTAQELVIPTQRGSPDRRPALSTDGEQKPILAPWMKDRAEFAYKMRDVGKRAAYIVGWHLLHAPANALRVLWFAACGLFYIVGNIWVWTFDLHSPKQEFTNEEYVKLNQNRERRLSQRGQVVGYGAGAIGLVGLIVWWATPPWASWGLLVAVVVVLALVGRPRDKPFIMPATIAPGEDVPLTADVVFEALC